MLSAVGGLKTNKTLLLKRKRRRRDFLSLSSFASDRFSGSSKPRVAIGFLFTARDADRRHPVINNNL
jgi:hypothetical protein